MVVIGAGAAGMLAAATAAQRGRRTVVLEKNARPGVKILMSGGTRCNLTHACDNRGIVKAYGEQGPFLHSALAVLSPPDLVQLIEAEGVPTKVEETGKIFPVSNRAEDIVTALLSLVARCGAELRRQEPVCELSPLAASAAPHRFALRTSAGVYHCESVIVATGGLSYPGSGTTGDGYPWAESLGHSIIPTHPALAPLTTSAGWVKELSGLTLPDVAVQAVVSARADLASPPPQLTGKKKKGPPGLLDQRRGSLLFAHFGLSGPVILDVSRVVTGHPQPTSLDLLLDFLPHEKAEPLDERLRQMFAAEGKKQVAVALAAVIPRRLAETLTRLCELPAEMRGAELSKERRQRLVAALKQTAVPISGSRGYAKAEVTAGGVSRDEVDSRTMESKLTPGLFFAGELLDLDGPIGGFNFQAAFATGKLAGLNA